MKIEVLYFEGCPNHLPAVELMREVAAELGIGADIQEVEVTDQAEAERLRFLGSPTIQVNGIDVEPEARLRLLGPALATATIGPGTYECQPEDAPAIQTLSTRAFLVTSENVSADVETITRVIFEGEAFIGIPGGGAAMAEEVPALSVTGSSRQHGLDPRPRRRGVKVNPYLEPTPKNRRARIAISC